MNNINPDYDINLDDEDLSDEDSDWDELLNSVWEQAEDSGIPFDHLMGEVLASGDY